MLPIALLLFGSAVGLAIWAVAGSAEEKATVRASLRQLEGYEVDNVREQELLKPVRDRFLALSERAAHIPPLRQKCEKLKQEISELEKALQALYESQEALGYDPVEYESLFREKKELASAERERQSIALLMAGESEARERLEGILAAKQRLEAEIQGCQEQISSLSYRPEEHEKARAALAQAGWSWRGQSGPDQRGRFRWEC